MISGTRKCKSISFNIADEIEIKLLEHAEKKKNFSKYVKRLIERDMKGLNNQGKKIVNEIEIDEIELEFEDEQDINENELKGFI